MDDDIQSQKSGIKEAEEAFKSPTQLAAARLGHRSPTKTASPQSRRSPYSGKSDPGRDEIMAQMAAATGVVVRKPSAEESPHDQASAALEKAKVALATASGVVNDGDPKNPPKVVSVVNSENTSGTKLKASSSKRSSSKDLDMKHNDNAFHVVANLVLDRFRSRITGNATSLDVTESDRAYLDQMLQPSVKKSFVEAVRFRLENNCPPDSEIPIHILTRECQELGLDREGDNNPLLANPTPEKRVVIAISVRYKNTLCAACSTNIRPCLYCFIHFHSRT